MRATVLLLLWMVILLLNEVPAALAKKKKRKKEEGLDRRSALEYRRHNERELLPKRYRDMGLDKYWTSCRCGEVTDDLSLTSSPPLPASSEEASMSSSEAGRHGRGHHGPRVKGSERRPWMVYMAITDRGGTRKGRSNLYKDAFAINESVRSTQISSTCIA